ncbi:MAG: HAMP domain-containing protein [Candidatus Riflebacteria bacterium]|nr:HAMP domain-containing protein [Candidatus Riflebacteria bacterium]
MSDSQPNRVFRVPEGGARRWLLPMFLTLAPLLLLYQTVLEERVRVADAQDRERVAASDPAVARLRAASHLKFWAEQTGRRLVRLVERRLRQEAGGSPPSLSHALADLGPRYRFAGAPPVKVWAFAWDNLPTVRKAGVSPHPPEGPEERAGLPPALAPAASTPAPGAGRQGGRTGPGPATVLRGPGLETTFGRAMAGIFEAVAASRFAPGPPPIPRPVLQRARETFGPGLNRDMLSAAGRGIAHHVIYQGQFHLLVWDFWMVRGRPAGGFFLLMPIPADRPDLALDLCLRHWRGLAGGRPFWPAFFQFPGPPLPGSPRRLLHPDLERLGLAPALRKRAREVGLRPARETLGKIDPARWLATDPARLPDVYGTLTFPVDRLGRCLPLGSWLTRLEVLRPDSRHFAFLVMPGPGARPTPLEMAWQALLVAWIIGWVLVFGVTAWRGRPAQPRVAVQLTGWFLCLAGVAGALVFSSHRQLRQDLENRLLDRMHQRLENLARTLEGEATRQGYRQGTVCNRLLLDPVLHRDLRRARLADDRAAPVLAPVWQALVRRGMEPQFVTAVGSGGYLLATFSPRIAPEEQSGLRTVLQQYGAPFFDEGAGPGEGSASAGFRTNQVFSTDRGHDLRHPGLLGTATLGGRQISRIHQFVRIGDRVILYLAAFWDRDQAFRRHLQRLLRRFHGQTGQEVAVFFQQGAFLEVVAQAGRVPTLRAAALEYLQKPRFRLEAGGRFLRYLYPSPLLPGYTFALRLSLEPVARRLAEEDASFAWLLGIGLGLTVLAGAALNAWLARPILGMTEALHRVDQGDFAVRVGLARQDELGRATATLDRMVEGLQERESMSRFVATGVMEVIRTDPGTTPPRGRREPVVMLFSDIRDFTTLSETHPPEAIFATLNRHFEAMTVPIQAEGGMIERFIGDAIQAVFTGRPGEPAADRALRAAHAMTARLADLQAARAAAGEFPYRMGIGLAAGEGITGVVGDPEVRQDLSVLGAVVREAAAMEAATKGLPPGAIACSTEVTRLAAPGWSFAPVPGHPGAWEVVSGADGLPPAPFRADVTADAPAGNHRGTGIDGPGPEPGRMATPRFDPGRASLWAGFLFWLLAWLVMGTVEGQWRDDLAGWRERQARQILRQDLLEVGKAAREKLQVPLLLRQVIHHAWRQATATPTDTMSEVPLCRHGWRRETPVSRIAKGPTVAPAGRRATPPLPTTPDTPNARGAASPTVPPDRPHGLEGPPTGFTGSVNPAATPSDRAIGRALERLRRLLPTMSWAIVQAGGPFPGQPQDERMLLQDIWWRRDAMGLPPKPESPGTRFIQAAAALGVIPRQQIPDGVFPARIIATGSRPLPLPPWQLVFLQWILERCRAGGSASPDPSDWESLFLPVIGEISRDLRSLFLECHGGFHMLNLEGREHLCFWEPLPLPGLATQTTSVFRPDRGYDSPPPLRASVLVFLPLEDLRLEAGLRAMIHRLGPTGTFLDMSPEGPLARPGGSSGLGSVGSGHRLAHPRARALGMPPLAWTEPVLRPTLHGGPEVFPATRRAGRLPPGWVRERAHLDTGVQRFRVEAFRRLPDARPPFALLVCWTARVLWLLAGALAAAFLSIGAGSPDLSLRTKLAGAFLAMVIPTLVISAGVLGRRAIAQQESTVSREAAGLERAIGQTEEAHDALLGWNCRLVSSLAAQPARQEGFLAWRPDTGPRARERNSPPLNDFYDEAIRLGSVLGNIGVGGPGLPIQSLNPSPAAPKDAQGTNLLIDILQLSVKAANPELGRGKGPGPLGNAREGLMVDEIVNALFLFSAGDLLADFFSAPEAFCRIVWGDNSLQVFRLFLPLDRPPRLILYAAWDSRGIMAPIAEAWRRRAREGHPAEFRLAGQTAPNVTIVRPYLRFRPSGPDRRWGGFHEFTSFDPPGLGQVITTAFQSGETISRILGTDGAAALVLARRSTTSPGFIFTMSSPVGVTLAGLAAQATRRQWFLVGLLAVTLVLARQIAVRFLAPLEAFSQAAGEITAGRFRLRLDIARTDEFGALAQAFNRMCRGIEEGRLLRRFVSESVRQAARDATRAEAARRGQHREAVVLFAGVPGFTDHLERTPPEAVLAALNAYLSRLARIIRAHEGEIDKFIGEKVLAVFSAETHGTLARAAGAALAAGQALARGPSRAASARARDAVLAVPPGVGIVTGRVLAGILGTPAVRLEYTVLGDPVNLASRLCDLAIREGGATVLLDAATAHLAAGGPLRCVPLGTTRVKGKTREVEVWRLDDPRPPPP